MDYNSDFRFDLELGQQGETTFGAIFSGAKIEVKTDFAAYRTGNFFIEYESRDKPSGLATTHAVYWCLIATKTPERVLDDNVLFMAVLPTERLKELCREIFAERGYVLGGDSNTSKGVLLPVSKVFL